MTQHHQHGHQHPHKKQAGVHKDWRLWTAVVLMLVAMAVYVMSFDEALGPEGQPQEAMENADAE